MHEHLRSQIEETGGRPRLTEKEIELVRYIRDDSAKWGAILVAQRSGDS